MISYCRPLYTEDDEEEEQDRAIPLSLASRLFDSRPSANAMHRWRIEGATARNGQRVRLDMLKIGGRWFVRPSAVEAFLQACNAPGIPTPSAPKGAASAALAAAGC